MLKVGVFGAGHLGKFHINNWKEIEGIKLVGFFDPNNDIAKAVTEEYGLKRYMDEDKLMDACDIIDVITPTFILLFACKPSVKANMFLLKNHLLLLSRKVVIWLAW